MFLRSVNLLMMSYSWYYGLYETHYTLMISLYVFAFNVFPFVMQMTTLLFGAYKLYNKRHKSDQNDQDQEGKKSKKLIERGLNDDSSSSSDESDYS